MPAQRDAIRMTDAEVDDFLGGRRTMNVASHSPDGTIHLVAMWYGFHDGHPSLETFGRSQKVLNLRRDPTFTALVEAGESYGELRGVQLVGTAVIHEDDETLLAVCRSVIGRYMPEITDPDQVEATAAVMARKRVAVELVPEKVVSWDHRKLGGGY
jgi:PPOX class probable F420-dependent enzyme